MSKFYAIKDDNNSIIVESWDEALKIIAEYNKPKYKSFKTKAEAQAFIDDVVLVDDVKEPKCYIDGSYDSNTGRYSFGGILIIDGKEYTFKKAYEPDEFSSSRNVAGEIKGAAFIINYCVKNNINTLHIFYDYEGIENWYKGIWKANSVIASSYVSYVDTIKDKINVVFHKVKSHTNNYYNDYADKLAKEALGI